MQDRSEWPARLRAAREAKFPTTWLAAKALQRLDPQHLPNMRELHRYWSQRWESGRVRPNRTYRELIEQLLGAPGLFDGSCAPGPNSTPAAGSAAGSAAASRPVEPVRQAEPARYGNAAHPGAAGRSNPGQGPFSVVGDGFAPSAGLTGVIAMAADDAARDAASMGEGHAERTLEQLHDDVLRAARGYPNRPLPDAFADARRIREFAVELAGRTRRPDQLADLNTIAGQACGLLSMATFDMGYWEPAARFADSAVSYAELAGHGSLRAWAMAAQVFMANWLGRPVDGLRLADAALALGTGRTATAQLRAYQARARALLGDRDGTADASRAAEEARQVEGQDEMYDSIGGEFSFVLARQELSFGTSYIALGDGTTAERHAQRALDLYAAMPADQRFYYDENAARVDLASARILRGDLDGARAALAAVFTLPPMRRTAGITSRLTNVCTLLTADVFDSSREASELAVDIADFVSDTSPRAIPPSDL